MHRVRHLLALPADNAALGRGVRVAVIDTGIDAEHPDFRDRVDHGASRALTRTHASLDDTNGHGTHVAGIIAGTGAASHGVYRGVAPSAELVVLRSAVIERAPEGNAVAAVAAAIDAGVDIINYSHGYRPDSVGDPPWVWPTAYSAVEEAFTLAASRGILCVVASGNTGPRAGSVTRPGGLPGVLTVGSWDGQEQTIAPTSGRGPFRRHPNLQRGRVERWDPEDHNLRGAVAVTAKPDVVTFGVGITAPRSRHARRDDEADPEALDPHYVTMSGTSQATAVASGLAAALLGEARANTVDLGPDPGQTLLRLVQHAGRRPGGPGVPGLAADEPRDGQPPAQESSRPGGPGPVSSGALDTSDYGRGLVIWPMLVATLNDFAHDAQFRSVILSNDALRLVD